MIYIETPTNPGLAIIDLEMVNALAKKYKLILNVDNCFATPVNQRPIDLGADLVVHSATKWLDGQGVCWVGLLSVKKNSSRIFIYFAAVPARPCHHLMHGY
jgi:O-succinylhomoserine sulfhydrylase